MLDFIILAGGKGTRMGGHFPKVLYPIAGQPMLFYLFDIIKNFTKKSCILVKNTELDNINLPNYIETVLQPKVLGTGNAVKLANDKLNKHSNINEIVVILYGDTPFVSEETVKKLISSIKEDKNIGITITAFIDELPNQYGKLLLDNSQSYVEKIIEYKEKGYTKLKDNLCNGGIMAIRKSLLCEIINKLKSSESSEEYLIDLIPLAKQHKYKTSYIIADKDELMGINTLEELAKAEKYIQDKLRKKWLQSGVFMQNPNSVFFSYDTIIGKCSIIEHHVHFGNGVTIGNNCHIKAFSYIEGGEIGNNVRVGPFARIRPGTQIKDQSSIGNFVEIKNSILDSGSKVNHLSYIGDSNIGKNTNIGAGTITCNYDGIKKHKTIIGKDVWVGANSSIVAPVNIKDNVRIGAGSTIRKDIEKNSLTVSSAKQRSIANKGNKQYLEKNV